MRRAAPRFALGPIVASLAAACASPGPAGVSMRVHNGSGADIASIRMKACADAATSYAPLPRTELRPGADVVVPLPGSCVDLEAHDRRGRVVARQEGLHALPGTTWTLR